MLSQMVPFAAIAFLILLNTKTTLALSDDMFCIVPGDASCNMTMADMTGQNFISLTYSSDSKTVVNDGGSHFEDGASMDGSEFDIVMRYYNNATTTFKRNFRVYPKNSNARINCDESGLFFGQNDTGLSFAEVNMNPGDEDESDGSFTYCNYNLDEVLSTEDMLDDSTVYFYFQNFTDDGEEIIVAFDYDTILIPSDYMDQFPFTIDDAVISLDISTTSIDVVLEVIVNRANELPIPETCGTLGDFITTNVYLNNDPDNCTLSLTENFTMPAEPEVDNVAYYEFTLTLEQLKQCSSSVQVGTESITMDTSVQISSTSGACNYFSPDSNSVPASITHDIVVDSNDLSQYVIFNTEIVNINAERCTPSEFYVIPQSYIVLMVQTTSVSDKIYWDSDQPATIGGSMLYGGVDPDVASPLPQRTCTTSQIADSESTLYDCIHYFHTRNCENMALDDDLNCILERPDKRPIKNMHFKEYIGDTDIYLNHAMATTQSNIQDQTFSMETCMSDSDTLTLNDVSEVFPISVEVKNYYSGGSTNWTSNATIDMSDKIIIRSTAGDPSTNPFTSLENSIKTVIITLREPTGDNQVIAQTTINAGEKTQLMKYTSSPYYADGIFCSWYDFNSTSERCNEFFDGQRKNQLNSLTGSLSTAVLEDMCQVTNTWRGFEDNSNTDFVLVKPENWFPTDYDRPYLVVDVETISVIGGCGARPQSSVGSSINTMYARGSTRFVIGDAGSNAETTQTVATGTFFENYPGMTIAAAITISVNLAFIAIFVASRCGNRRARELMQGGNVGRKPGHRIVRDEFSF